MPVPTADEAAIYKSPFKQFQVKTLIRLDQVVFESPVRDDFNGSELDSTKWHSFSPSWGLLSVGGGEVSFGTSSPGISESFFVSKPNVWFPKSIDHDWTLQLRVKVTGFNSHGTFITIGSLQKFRGLMRIGANLAEGLYLEMPATTSPHFVDYGLDTSYKTYRLVYTASTQMYEVFVDEEGGGGFISQGTLSAVNYRADYIVFGNAAVRQGGVADWTTMTVDYIQMTGTTEAFEVPEWAGPEYLYDDLQYQQELWAELPSVIRGRIDISKDSESDTLDLDLINLTYLDKGDPLIRVYTNFNFMNRFIKVLSRVNNGISWTPWRQIFLGSCDEKQTEQRDTGEVVLTVRARDWIHKRLAETRVIRAYSDYGLVVEGMVMNLYVHEIIQDIAQNVCGLPYSAIDVPATPNNRPRTWNVAGTPAATAIRELLDGMGFVQWVNHETGQVIMRPSPDIVSGDIDYWLKTDEEVELVNWNQSTLDHTAQVEVGIANTTFQNGGFSEAYPITPIPFYGRIEFVDSVVAQSNADLNAENTPHRIWWNLIRDLGSVVVHASCQDWLEHNLEIGLLDNTYLGLNADDGPWFIEGWMHEWEGTQTFSQEITLLNQHPDRVVRESLTEHVNVP